MTGINTALRHLLNAHPERAQKALEAVISGLPDLEHDALMRTSRVIDAIATALTDEAA